MRSGNYLLFPSISHFDPKAAFRLARMQRFSYNWSRANLPNEVTMRLSPIVLLLVAGFGNAALAADYKPEFRMSVVANEDTAWGRAANRFANAVRFRTKGRINIRNYFEGQLFTG